MQSIKNIIHLVVSLLIVQLPHLKIYSIVNIYTNKTCLDMPRLYKKLELCHHYHVGVTKKHLTTHCNALFNTILLDLHIYSQLVPVMYFNY